AAVIKLLCPDISNANLQHHRKNIAVRQCFFGVSEQHLTELSAAVFGRDADRRQMAESRFRDHHKSKSDELAEFRAYLIAQNAGFIQQIIERVTRVIFAVRET